MSDEPTPDEPQFNDYRGMCDWIGEQLRSGAMWAAWGDDGRFGYGDDQNPLPDGMTAADPANEYGLGVLVGSIASHMMARTAMAAQAAKTAQNRLVQAPPGANRAQRRAIARDAQRRDNGLWTPGQ